jgi:hypothetical protein
MVGPSACVLVCVVSRIDRVNSGSYLTEPFVEVLGITILDGLGGSFLMIGCTFGFIETSDFGSTPPFLTGAISGLATGTAVAFTTGLDAAFGEDLAEGFPAAVRATLVTAFLGAVLTGFLPVTFFGEGFVFFTVFFAAGFFGAGFFLGAGLAFQLLGRDGFLGAGFFLVAIVLPFF